MPDPPISPDARGSAKPDFAAAEGKGNPRADNSGAAPDFSSEEDGSAADAAAGDGEVEVLITPRAAVLDELQVTEEEFEWALGRALDLLEEGPEDEEVAALEDVEIWLNGRTFRLEEVAEVEIGGDLSELGPLPDPAADGEDDDGLDEEG
ncbi:hypothetical protein [Alienimonas sp. DA493]|uniref:hypothetical protein n=1 Tax=Alienimonas sp. DA493 TaxID=3373605 RepID=UPI003753F6DC